MGAGDGQHNPGIAIRGRTAKHDHIGQKPESLFVRHFSPVILTKLELLTADVRNITCRRSQLPLSLPFIPIKNG